MAAKGGTFSSMSLEELVAEQQKNANERASYEAQYKARGRELQAAIDKRVTEQRFRSQLEGLDPDVQRAIIAGMAAELDERAEG